MRKDDHSTLVSSYPRPLKRVSPPRNENEDPLSSSSNIKRRLTLLGPRPMFSTSSRTNTHNNHQSNSSFDHIYPETMSSKRKNVSSDFLPKVSFDEMHASITGVSSDLNSRYPMLLSSSTSALNTSSYKDTPSMVPRRRQPSLSTLPIHQHSMPPPSAPATSSIISSSSNSNTTTNARTSRRQSINPPAYQPMPKTAKKPLTASSSSSASSNLRSASTEEPKLLRIPNAPTQSFLARTGSISKPYNSRPKSLHPPPQFTQSSSRYPPHSDVFSQSEQITASPRLGNHHINTPSSSNLHVQAQNQANATNNNNASNSSRRSSVHASGLGARTISPTDARRMKRLSVKFPNPPSPPPPPPFAQFSQPNLLPPNSPQLMTMFPIPNSNSNPNSARTTPDFQKKQSYSSSHAIPSRLPALNPRSSHTSVSSTNGGVVSGVSDDEVPPVPAIPKAYESPNDQINDPVYLHVRKSISNASENSDGATSLPNSRHSTAKPFVSQPTIPITTSTSISTSIQPRHRRGLTVGTGSDSERPPPQQILSKKTLSAAQLPPLHLLPLSTPTFAKIGAFPSSDSHSRGLDFTPPKRNITKTPSTPMTASKAAFFAGSHANNDHLAFNSYRSNTSLQSLQHSDLESLHIPIPLAIPSAGPRNNNASPFASNSLPKLNDFNKFASPSPSLEPPPSFSRSFAGHSHSQPQPRLQNYSNQHINQADHHHQYHHHHEQSSNAGHIAQAQYPVAHNTSSDEVKVPASTGTGTSLRRKLSFTWKRASSKASQRGSNEKNDAKFKPPEMPKPKIPPSATWSTRTSSDSGSNRPFNHETSSSRKASTASIKETGSFSDSSAKESQLSRTMSTSLLAPVHRMMGTNKLSQNAAHSASPISSSNNGTANIGSKGCKLEINPETDNLAADKVMEKLASKRKDFEQATKVIDELRRRACAKEKLDPTQAIQTVSLNIFERGEIVDFESVYFCGTKSVKKIIGNPDNLSTNFGYDDDRGDYNIILGDHLAYRYEVVDVLGKGSFGQVVRCIDHRTGGLVAIKIIRNKKRFHQQALVEVNILQKLRDWDPDNKHSMINFTQYFYFRGHLCIATELLGMNLYEFIKAHDFKGFNLVLIRRFAKQMLSSLVLLKGKRVIHCDLKPENILLAHPMQSEIKVIDFGSSCFENEKVYTYIQSRFYRSPEVILGLSYGIPIDMWSLGCILAELFTGYPIFPGENEQDQLACIMEIFGPPEKHLIEKASRRKLFFDSLGKPRVTVSSKGRRRRPSTRTLQSAIKCDDEAFLDFLGQCLRWDPERRLKPDQATQHEFLTGIKGPLVQSSTYHRILTAAHQRPTMKAPSHSYNSSPSKRATAAFSSLVNQPSQRQASGARPLPEPPNNSNSSLPSLARANNHGSSPIKHSMFSGGPRRHSTVSGGLPGSLVPGGGGGTGTAIGTGTGHSKRTTALIGMGKNLSNLGHFRGLSGRSMLETSTNNSKSGTNINGSGNSMGATAAVTGRS